MPGRKNLLVAASYAPYNQKVSYFGFIAKVLFYKDIMEKYLEVTTVRESERLDRSCAALERAGIPVIVRHVDIVQGAERHPGFTLLVPSEHSNHAQKLIGDWIAQPAQ